MLVLGNKVGLELLKLVHYSVNSLKIDFVRLRILGKHSSEDGLNALLRREQFVLALDRSARLRVFLAVPTNREAKLARSRLLVLGSAALNFPLTLRQRIHCNRGRTELDVHKRSIRYCAEQVFQPDLFLAILTYPFTVKGGYKWLELLQAFKFL